MTQKITPFSSERLLDVLQQLPRTGIYRVGFSGGADSTALLHALAELQPDLPSEVRVLHVDHGLNPESRAWRKHCKTFCDRLGVSLDTRRIEVDLDSGLGLEAAARRQRYGIVEELLGEGEIFLTAHHLDDQAETLLLNLARGSGLDGLAGMPLVRRLGKGLLARPLLEFSMESLRTYLQARELTWIEDPSNRDQAYDRNYVRHSLIPLLETRWPGCSRRIAKSASLCRSASVALSAWAEAMLEGHLPHEQVFELTGLKPGNEHLGFLIRHWLRINDAPPLPSRRLEELCRQTIRATSRSHVSVEWEGWTIHLYENSLWLQKTRAVHECPCLAWDQLAPLRLGGGLGRLELQPPGRPMPGNVRVGQRRGGERVETTGKSEGRALKDVLREARVPPWLRQSIPLLFRDDRLIAVADLHISEELAAWLRKSSMKLVWQPDDPLLSYVHEKSLMPTVDRTPTLG